VRVVLTHLVDHPVDSRARSFAQAALQAMAQAFEAAGVLAVRAEPQRTDRQPLGRGGSTGSD
jgi:hypothetical protein